MRGLSESVSPDVLDAMKKLVSAVMKGMGASEVSAETLTSQSGAALSQLCMWQLVVGFNLRELEVRNELQARRRACSWRPTRTRTPPRAGSE